MVGEVTEKNNFIDKISRALKLKVDKVNTDLTYTSAHTLIGSVTGDKIYVSTHLGPLSPDILCMVVAESGTNKTLIHTPVYKSIKEMKLIIPAVFTTQSLPHYFAKRRVVDGEEFGYINPNYGLVFWNEASGQFAEAQTKEWRRGVIEMLSDIYDHTLKETYVKDEERCVINPQNPYISLLGNMVPKYFLNIPETFFAQGIAGRMHWCYISAEHPGKLEDEPDWNKLSNYNEYIDEFDTVNKRLVKLHSQLRDLKNSHRVLIDDNANKLIKEFSYKCKMEWYLGSQHNPFGWNWQYFKRLPEMGCKAALRYAIADNIDDINGLKNITGETMKRGIQFAKASSEALEKLFAIRIGMASKISPFERACNALREANNGMLTNKQWQNNSGVTNNNDWQRLREDVISKGYAVEIDKSIIENEDEMSRLQVRTAAKIYKWIKTT